MRVAALLAIAATAALASTVDGTPVKVQTTFKHPVVKEVKQDHGKVRIILAEGATVETKHAPVKKPEAKKPHDKHHKAKIIAKSYSEIKKHETKHAPVHKPEVKKHEVKKPEVKKHEVKKPEIKKPEVKKHDEKKHEAKKPIVKKPEVKKPEVKKAHGKDVHEEIKENGEIIRKYAHGSVRIIAKNQPAQHTDAHHKAAPVKKVEPKKDEKKHQKKHHSKEEELPEPLLPASDEDTSTDVSLEKGETVSLTFGEHAINLTLHSDGTLELTADGETHLLPAADDVDLTFEGDFVGDFSSSGSGSGTFDDIVEAAPTGVLATVEKDVSDVAKKFTELATQLTGNGKFFSRESAPIIFVGGVIGALAAIVGIAAIAIGRARDNAAAADPQSVLAEATEDVDVEANVTAEEASTDDVAAEDSESLDGSDSEAEAEADQEEGKFTNEASV